MVQPPIDFEAKSDHDLIILTAQATNIMSQQQLPELKDKLDELNGTVREHSVKLAKVETKARCQDSRWRDRKVLIGSAASGLLVAIFYALGNALGWW